MNIFELEFRQESLGKVPFGGGGWIIFGLVIKIASGEGVIPTGVSSPQHSPLRSGPGSVQQKLKLAFDLVDLVLFGLGPLAAISCRKLISENAARPCKYIQLGKIIEKHLEMPDWNL